MSQSSIMLDNLVKKYFRFVMKQAGEEDAEYADFIEMTEQIRIQMEKEKTLAHYFHNWYMYCSSNRK